MFMNGLSEYTDKKMTNRMSVLGNVAMSPKVIHKISQV